MATIKTSIVGRDGVIQRLQALKARAKDLRPFWQEIFGPQYFRALQDMFALEGQRRGDKGRFSKGGQWAPLSPRYAAWKAKHFPGTRILERTGDLRDSLRWMGRGLGPGGIWEPEPTVLTFGTAIPYATYHQKGTGSIPARPFLDPVDKSVFAPQLKVWLAGAVQ